MSISIDSSNDMINGSDIADRIEELEDMRDDWQDEHDGEAWDEPEADELEQLEELRGQLPDRLSDVTLINDAYMDDDWARRECEECGDIPDSLPHYISAHIDWNGVRDDLQQDYSSVEFDGVTFYYLSR